MVGRRRWKAAAIATALGLALLAACSGDDSVTTAAPEADAGADAATETATDAVTDGQPTAAGGDPDDSDEPEAGESPRAGGGETTDAAPDASGPLYTSEGIHAILEGSCARCHSPGGPGATHMSLATAVDAAIYADSIGLVTQAEAMPPWPASDLSVAFVDDHSLTQDQIDSIDRWVQAGGGIDVEPDTPIVATKPLATLEEPDLVLTSAKGAYTGSTDVLDDYRCLIFDPELEEPEWILASHFEPDQVEVVHHGIITLVSQELRAQAEARDAAEDGPGWTCYGLNQFDMSQGGYQFRMAGWAPGAQPARQPDGYAIPFRPGDFLIVQVHYHFDDTAPPDLSRMVFDLASDEQVAAVGGAYPSLTGNLYLGPAEIPCYEGDTNPLCDRDAALARVAEKYGRFSAALPDFFLAQCDSTPEDYEAMTDGDAWSQCDLPVQNPGRIVSLTGHMHELGKSIRLTLNPGEPDETILLDIPDWDFEWQLSYRPIDDIVIDRGDTIRVDCAWNRERAPYEAEGYVLWADGTGDEMCFTNITTAPL